MIEKYVEYEHNGTIFEGYLALDEERGLPRPAVLIAHTWAGRSEFVCDKARILAGQGYLAFALDLYGKGVIGTSPEENGRLMQPLLDDRALLQARMLKALDVVRAQDEVDNRKIAAIGYCLGGLCVLDLARVSGNVQGVVSFHGLLGKPGNTDGQPISAKVLVLHGHGRSDGSGRRRRSSRTRTHRSRCGLAINCIRQYDAFIHESQRQRSGDGDGIQRRRRPSLLDKFDEFSERSFLLRARAVAGSRIQNQSQNYSCLR